MQRKWIIAALILALCSLLLSCGSGNNQEAGPTPTTAPTSAAGLPNPAAVYCQEQGYTYEIRTAADGSQSGACIFPDGSECDGWAFYRGECAAPQSAAPTTAPTGAAGLPNPAAVYCQEQGYAYEIRTAADGSQSGVCIFPDGSECDEWAFYRGECAAPQPAATTSAPATVQATLRLDRTTFAPREEIQLQFAASAALPEGAWVGIIPSDVPHGSEATNDEYDLDYQWLSGQVSGMLTFVAPERAGSYDFRIHDTEDDGHELASVTFQVVAGTEGAALWLDKTTYAPGEEIQVHFTAPATFPNGAWVGIIPSEVPHGSEATNDEYDLDYQYLEGQVAGVLTFPAPGQPGSYDFRMHDTDSDGQEVASVTFQVVADNEGAALWLDKATFVPGGEIQVHFTAPASFPESAWVGLIPSDVPHGSSATNDEYDLDYRYLEGQVSGVLTFVAPGQPGSYDFRMHNTDTDGQEVASVTFEVVADNEGAALWLDKTTFAPEEEIQVHFTAPASFPDSAWVGLIPSEVPHGSSATNDEYDLDYRYLEGQVAGVLTFPAPTEPGSYDFRMHNTDSDGQEVASVTFEVRSD
jgi:putative hemolysin